MFVAKGLYALMRDGRIVEITDAADSGEPRGEYQWINKEVYDATGEEVVMASMPAETIFVGVERFLRVGSTAVDIANLAPYKGGTVVSDMSEVVSILT